MGDFTVPAVGSVAASSALIEKVARLYEVTDPDIAFAFATGRLQALAALVGAAAELRRRFGKGVRLALAFRSGLPTEYWPMLVVTVHSGRPAQEAAGILDDFELNWASGNAAEGCEVLHFTHAW